mgnify:CR=1 FL=1
MTPFYAGIIVTLAGTGEVGYAGDGGPANRAVLADPFGCDFDSQGHIYMCAVSYTHLTLPTSDLV